LKGEPVIIKGHDFDIKEEMVAIAVGTTGSSSVAILDKDGKWRKTHLLREGDEITEAVHAGEKCCVLYVNIKFKTSGWLVTFKAPAPSCCNSTPAFKQVSKWNLTSEIWWRKFYFVFHSIMDVD
jgi:hypothetical protein